MKPRPSMQLLSGTRSVYTSFKDVYAIETIVRVVFLAFFGKPFVELLAFCDLGREMDRKKTVCIFTVLTAEMPFLAPSGKRCGRIVT